MKKLHVPCAPHVFRKNVLKAFITQFSAAAVARDEFKKDPKVATKLCDTDGKKYSFSDSVVAAVQGCFPKTGKQYVFLK